MSDAVICGAVRTPVARRGGAFKNIHPSDLGAMALNALVERTGVQPAQVEDVIFGCVTQVNEQGANVARQAVLSAGWPVDVPGVSVNRMCGSGQQAMNFAGALVASGHHDLLVAGGVESMTRVPIMSDQAPELVAKSITDQYDIINQGLSAEMIADKWNLAREDLDKFALESHKRAIRAIDEKRFEREIKPIQVTQDGGQILLFATDEHPRRESTLEKLAGLKPAFKPNGKVTAGNSSGINDAACALLIANRETAKRLGLPIRATIKQTAVAGVDPTIMLTGPIPATQKVLAKAKLGIDDVDLYECNEAFASIPLAWMKETHVPHSKVNVNGGAIALGHPLGASGARLLTTLLHELERTKKDVGLSTMCIGFGQGIATIIERE
ncbi:MAG TPA: thiolase family protein [Candidatus Thermoplasmatota archaeon]|nr:thiolase family protein [Candidatus Thermoplasmatota archaeon]